MQGLSEADTARIIAIERGCSAISLMGCLFVLITFTVSDAFRQRAINRMVFYATFGNMLTNVATLMTTSFTHSVDSFGCQLQAFLIQVFMQGDAYWAMSMAINVYLTFYHKYDARQLRKMEIWYFLGCYGVPFIPGFTFFWVSQEGKGRPYGNAVLWCWLKPEWDIWRIVSFYGPIWVAITIAFIIYIRAGREIYRKRQKMLNFSSSATATGTAAGGEPFSPQNEFSPAFNFKTTEVTQTTEIISTPAPAANPRSGTVSPPPNPSYSVTISADAQAHHSRPSLEDSDTDLSAGSLTLAGAPSHPQPATTITTTTTTTAPAIPPAPTTTNRPKRPRLSTQVSIAPTVTATVTSIHAGGPAAGGNQHHHHRRAHIESHNAIWSYTKCAVLFFTVLLITWIPSSANRVYSIVHNGEVSRSLFFASAFVLPLQGFWNGVIYIVTSWAACKSLWGSMVLGFGGVLDKCGGCVGRRRRVSSVVEITDVKMRRMGGASTQAGDLEQGQQQQQQQQGQRHPVGMWMRGGRKERNSESTSMEDLTGDVHGDRIEHV
ncbi:hypothetical protein VTJ49DRAFT_3590 [Mycothermus thermophilus]|uniref:G-protein coupled receptors family 2 profile 2 domain-containing protein n=1 Tax=Humicola insolens TaxID=85995 RepID=A0ABR3VM38_HUMIN